MEKNSSRIVYLVGTSTTTRGGIGYVIGAYLSSDLNTRFRLIHIVTHQDGKASRKAWVYIKAVMRFICSMVLHGGDLVHIHSSSGPSFLRKATFYFLSRTFRCRIMFHVHSGGFVDYYESRGKAMRFLIRYILKRSDCVVVLTGSWKKKIEEMVNSGVRISVIGNPIDTLKYHPFPKSSKPQQSIRLLFLGALIRNKGVYDILDCLGHLKGRGLCFRLTLAGDRELDKVRLHSQKQGVEDLIDLPGWVSESAKLSLLKVSDLLLLPSYKEGLPLCVLEAMAFGLPVVCSNVGGLGDLVKHGVNGFIMTPGDIEAMSEYIVALAQDPALRERMGLNNAKIVQELYSIPAVAGEVGNVYHEMLCQPKRAYFRA